MRASNPGLTPMSRAAANGRDVPEPGADNGWRERPGGRGEPQVAGFGEDPKSNTLNAGKRNSARKSMVLALRRHLATARRWYSTGDTVFGREHLTVTHFLVVLLALVFGDQLVFVEAAHGGRTAKKNRLTRAWSILNEQHDSTGAGRDRQHGL